MVKDELSASRSPIPNAGARPKLARNGAKEASCSTADHRSPQTPPVLGLHLSRFRSLVCRDERPFCGMRQSLPDLISSGLIAASLQPGGNQMRPSQSEHNSSGKLASSNRRAVLRGIAISITPPALIASADAIADASRGVLLAAAGSNSTQSKLTHRTVYANGFRFHVA